jgi:hypothetical protein
VFGVLRGKRLALLDCFEPNSRCLDSELVENKYERVRPYKTNRYLTLEQEKVAIEKKLSLKRRIENFV